MSAQTVAEAAAIEAEGRTINGGLIEDTLVVSEIFGPTFQGEGPSIGTPCYFLRFGGCNQHCSWCDTPYTWAFSDALAAKHQSGKKYNPRVELRKLSSRDIIVELESLPARVRGVNLLVISGGEPLLQQRKLIPLLETLAGRGWLFEIETAGTIGPIRELTRIVHRFNVSPKLESSGNPLTQRYKPQALKALQETGRVAWKFVITDIEDLKEVDHIVKENSLWPIYCMPEGVSGEAINTHAQMIAQEVLKRGWNMTTRLQILLYGNRRGV